VEDLASADPVPEIDTARPHPARMYDYYLGGKNNFAADRDMAAKVLSAAPDTRTFARENRAFLGRAVRYLAREAGIRQFLDIGAGLPTADNVHEVAQRVTPSSRVVYVDNDPLVLAHARALLIGTPEGRTAYVHADLRDPGSIVSNAVIREVLDFSQPIALILVAILHFIMDEDKPADIIKTLLDALPPGSYLVASHATMEHAPVMADAAEQALRNAGVCTRMRDSSEFGELAFSGLGLVPPGLVLVSEWRPEGTRPRPAPYEVSCYGAVAGKP
jgi:hypothetical protein